MPESMKPAPAAGEPRSQAQTLIRHIGKPASDWNVDDLLAFVRDQDIKVLSLMHVGGDGWLKTLDFVPRDAAHLADVLTGGERADGSSLFGDLGIPVGASDIVMRPRLSTAFFDISVASWPVPGSRVTQIPPGFKARWALRKAATSSSAWCRQS